MSKIKVLVVDDSAFSRRTITKMLEECEGIEVVGYAVDGEEGISKVISLKPDLVTLDLEMPKMDGFTLLRILESRFSIPVIVISALSAADKVFKALELGALDFIAKPTSTASLELLQIKTDLQKKVCNLVKLKRHDQHAIKPRRGVAEMPEQIVHAAGTAAAKVARRHRFDVVAIGASTGGPPALQQIFSSLDRYLPFAVVVSQHMPSGFTRVFAERLNRLCSFDVKEAEDGDPVLPGHILIAPGGSNMTFEERDGFVVARIVPPSAEDRYVPSVDVMMNSCAQVYKSRMVGVIMTGMGSDGSRGIRPVKEHGGYLIAESEETSVVYGMPREAVATGLVDAVLPLGQIAHEILHIGGYIE